MDVFQRHHRFASFHKPKDQRPRRFKEESPSQSSEKHADRSIDNNLAMLNRVPRISMSGRYMHPVTITEDHRHPPFNRFVLLAWYGSIGIQFARVQDPLGVHRVLQPFHYFDRAVSKFLPKVDLSTRGLSNVVFASSSSLLTFLPTPTPCSPKRSSTGQ